MSAGRLSLWLLRVGGAGVSWCTIACVVLTWAALPSSPLWGLQPMALAARGHGQGCPVKCRHPPFHPLLAKV